MTHGMIGGAQIEEMIAEIRRAGSAAGEAAARRGPDCMMSLVAVGTGAAMLGIGQMAGVLIDRLESEGAQPVADCATWVATAMWHNGELAWRRESNGSQFRAHCIECGGLTYETGQAQYMAGCLTVLQAISSIAVIEGAGRAMNPIQVRTLARSCENDLAAMIEAVFKR